MSSLGQERPLKPAQQFSSFQGKFDSSEDLLGTAKGVASAEEGLGHGKELSKDWGDLRESQRPCETCPEPGPSIFTNIRF